MSTEQPNRPTSSRSGMPMGSTVAIVVAAVAVLLGLLVLKKIISDDDNSTSPKTENTLPPVTSPPDTEVSVPLTPDTDPPAAPAGTKKGATVQVANASNQGGVAKLASALLKADGFATGAAVSSADKLEKTLVYYVSGDAAAEAVAATVADTVCAPAPVELPATFKADPALASDTGVVLALGNDKAGKTLAKMCASSTKTDTKSTDASTDAATDETSA